MEKQLLKEQIGQNGSIEINYKDGKAILSAGIEGSIGKLSISGEMNALNLAIMGLEMAKEKIPGHFDDMAIDGAIALLKGMA